jgi:hypothetical protein
MIKPNNAGLLPKCTKELKMAKLGLPLSEIVPIRLAGFTPVTELIRFSRFTLAVF